MLDNIGSYKREDAIFLLKNINGLIKEEDNKTREAKIQSGVHYSMMLPIEYKPSDEYVDLFHKSLGKYKLKIASYVRDIALKIYDKKDKNLVLVSLARAGTPAGILIKRYLKYQKNIDIPHYSISIIRGRGFDENALKYILKNHKNANIQFVDGWTGKGAITNVLKKGVKDFYDKYNTLLDDSLAVIADPGSCTNLFGTRNDFLLPSACLNSTVSGLVSRTVLRDDIIKENDFHGARFYEELKDEDLSNYFVDEITNEFANLKEEKINFDISNIDVNFEGLKDVNRIKEEFEISDINFIKPGVGETTRVLLRRVPDLVLINKNYKAHEDLNHIYKLAKEKDIKIREYDLFNYKCCGIIKNIKKGSI
ncbi:cysteine protease StiP family protein [Peptostreptococcaceae bacterium AGR-M142]